MPPRRVLQSDFPITYSPLVPPQASVRHSSKNDLALGLGLGCSLGILLVAVVSALFFYHQLKTRRTNPYDISTSKSLQRFSYQQLKKATGSFSETRKLGQGGFGEVFKGELRNGDEIAVKTVDVSSVQGEVAFQSEVSILGRVTSPHIVQLLGFCAHGPRRLLVYEFMANRNLQEALFDEVYAVPLNWDVRFRIILNVAEALAYLHFKCDPPIIHGDVKPSNVLLSTNFQAKLADFGLARPKTAECILGVQTLEVQREAIEKERVRYEKIVRDRTRRQKRRDEAERKKADEAAAAANSGRGDSMESFAFDPNPEGDRKSSASMFDGLSTEEETSGFTLESPCSKAGNNTPTSAIRTCNGGTESPALANGKALRAINDVTDTEEISWQDCDESRSFPSSPISISNEISADADCENFMSAEEGETDIDKSVMSMDGTGEEGWSTVSPSQPDLEFNFESNDAQKQQKGELKGNRLRSWSREWWRKQEKDDGNRSQHIQDSDTKSIRSSTIEQQRSGELISEAGETRRPKNRVSDLRRQRSKSSGWIGAIVGELSKEAKKKPAAKHDKLKGREWWREEYCEELSNKSREFKKGSSMRLDRNRSSRRHKKDDYTKWIRDFSQEFSDELGHSKNLEHRRESRKSRSRREEFWSGDSAYRGISSTPSMRGTICYVAPESGRAGSTSEKADVYSFGVLLLVIISGRRPLQVNASPLTDFERANLISWARLLAQTGNILDLVDSNLHSIFSDEQAALCITVALLCLQRLPAARPSMNDIVKILNGELVAPDLPFEFSPSPPGFRSRRKPSSEEIVLERAPVTF